MALARTLRLGPTARRFVIEPVLGAVFPTPCVACKRLLDEPGVGLLCPDCVASIRRFTGSACRCGTPLPGAGEQDAVCGRCRRGATAWSRGASLGPHEDVLRSAIHALKYGGRRRLARQLASALLEGGRTEDVLEGDIALVPVPLHRRRERERGFNQSAVIARALARLVGGTPVVDALVRFKDTPSQAALSAHARRRNVAGAFGLAGARAVAGRSVVLVDDVLTTGATLTACARVLEGAGVADVRCVTLARAV